MGITTTSMGPILVCNFRKFEIPVKKSCRKQGFLLTG
jgi:hypothetical protein